MDKAIEQQIASLAGLSRLELSAEFRRMFGKSPGPRNSRELLQLAIAYRLQERALGSLGANARHQLSRRPDSRGRALTGAPKIHCKPGTRFVRRWQGDDHHVTAQEQGFEYQGQRYASLSEVARRITGTRWSGPAFFGLRKPSGKREGQ